MRRHGSHRFRFRRVLTALILPMVVASVGCGGHYSDAQRLTAAGHAAEADAMGSDGVTTTTDRVGAPGVTALPAAESGNAALSSGGGAVVPAVGSAGGAQAATGAGTTSAQAVTGAGTASAQAAAGGSNAGRARGSAAAGGGGSAGSEPVIAGAGPVTGGNPAVAPGAGTATPTGAREPIKLGVIGVRSGVLGRIFVPYYEGALAWAGDVNRRGGVAGHPVQLIAVDDGDDPRKATALAKRLVENDKVTAFYASHQFTTFDAIIPYLEEQGMPVIGSAPSNVLHENTPIYFNISVSSILGLTWNHLLPLMLEHPDIKDIAIMYCAEAQVCRVVNSTLQEIAPKHGYNIRYTAQVSVAQPDYTAEVIAARSAGAKAIILPIDNNSAVRIATSAHRQGYEPVFAIQATAHAEALLRDGGKDVEGFVVGGQVRHWTSPLMADFRAAYQAYVPHGLGMSSTAMQAWVSGKLLEKVAPTWPANPTPADVIASLRALKGETLGGLIMPRTFVPGERSGTLCSTIFKVDGGQFVPYQGRDDYHCPPGQAG